MLGGKRCGFDLESKDPDPLVVRVPMHRNVAADLGSKPYVCPEILGVMVLESRR